MTGLKTPVKTDLIPRTCLGGSPSIEERGKCDCDR